MARRELDTPVIAHGRQRRSSRARSVLALIGITMAVVLVAGGSLAAIAVWRVVNTASQSGENIFTAGQAPPTVGPIDGPVNILLVGSDSGGGNAIYGQRGETLNDVTMLLHISPDSNSATAISFPRDLVIRHPECTDADGDTYAAMSARPINEALTRGGLACVVTTVSSLTGLDIQYAAQIEFDGVIAMSDAIGGVTVCVAQPINDREIGWKLDAGQQTLQGYNALQFLRTRHGVGDGGDLTRISNQQVFLSALMRQVKSADTLTNPVKLYGLATAAVDHITLSKELARPDTMVSMALALRAIPLDRIVFLQYPSATDPANVNKVVPNITAAKILTDAVKNDQAMIPGKVGGGVGEAAPDPNATPDPSASPGATDAPSDALQLPESITGQSAETSTCSNAG